MSNTEELFVFSFRALHVSSFSFMEFNVSAYPLSLAGLTHTECGEKKWEVSVVCSETSLIKVLQVFVDIYVVGVSAHETKWR